MTASKGQTGTPITTFDWTEDGMEPLSWGDYVRKEDHERSLSHADAAGYARAIEDGLRTCKLLEAVAQEDGEKVAVTYLRTAQAQLRTLLKPAQDKGAAHE